MIYVPMPNYQTTKVSVYVSLPIFECDGSVESADVCQCRSSFLAFSIAINQGTGDRLAESTPLLWFRGIPTVRAGGVRGGQIRTGDLILSGDVSERRGKLIRVLGD